MVLGRGTVMIVCVMVPGCCVYGVGVAYLMQYIPPQPSMHTGPPPTTTSTTKHDTAARITDALAAGASAADVIDTIRNDADAHQVDADITRLTTLLQTHNNTWPWCPVLPEATLPPQPASPSRSSHLSHLPMTPLGTPLSGTPLGTPATAAGGGGQPLLSTGRSRLATQIKEYARVRRLSFGGGGGGGKDVRGQGVVGGGGVQGTGKGHHGNENHVVEKQDAHAENNTINVDNDNNDDDSVLASLPAALRRRSMDGTLPIALSTIKVGVLLFGCCCRCVVVVGVLL